MPLAGAFLSKSEIKNEFLYPMAMQFCRDCSSVQVDTVIPLDVLFKKYFYFSSSINTLIEHFFDLSNMVSKKYLKNGGNVLEIGCNDGVFLNHMVKKNGVNCIGVDPAKNVIKKISNKKINAYNKPFNLELAKKIKSRFHKIDLIVSSFSFGHIDNMKSVAEGINTLLDKNGTFISKTFSSKDSKLYEYIQLSYKKLDKKKIIHGITGVIRFKDNLDSCLEEMKSIDKGLSEMFPNSKRTDWGKYKMASGNGFYYPITFDFKDESSAMVSCQDFNDSSNIDNNLKVSIFTAEFSLFLEQEN